MAHSDAAEGLCVLRVFGVGFDAGDEWHVPLFWPSAADAYWVAAEEPGCVRALSLAWTAPSSGRKRPRVTERQLQLCSVVFASWACVAFVGNKDGDGSVPLLPRNRRCGPTAGRGTMEAWASR